MSFARWSVRPRRLPLLFLVVMLIPAAALMWLTAALLDREGQLQQERVRQRIESAADRIVALSHRRLAELGAALRQVATEADPALPAHTVLVMAEGDRVTVTPPGSLLYQPTTPTSPLPWGTFFDGERYEYRLNNPVRAAAWFDELAGRTDNERTRAGALVRLARSQVKAGRIDAALATYDELARYGAMTVDGLPAAMLALVGRCTILERAGRADDVRVAARTLLSGLTTGVWSIRRDAFESYLEEARRWAGETTGFDADPDKVAIAAAFQATHEQWIAAGDVSQRQWFLAEGRPVLMAASASAERLTVLLADVRFLADAWVGEAGVHVVLGDSTGRPLLSPVGSERTSAPAVVRLPDATQLPWTLRVVATDLESDRVQAQERRGLVLGGLAAVLALLGGSVYFALRGVSRELAVARLQTDFVSAVSHEFRTPLASVRHLSDLLAQGRVADEPQRQQCYEFLSRESERLEGLVSDLLDFGRLEGGAYQYRFEPIDVAPLLRGLVEECQHTLGVNGHRLDLSIQGEPAVILADREALSRAIRNLVDNAVKYSPGADRVWIDLKAEDAMVVVAVRDAGLGIAADEQQEIFGKFVRGRDARRRQIKGTGIGLAMVRHIAEAHHGDVRVDSRVNEGSTFFLRLPAGRPA